MKNHTKLSISLSVTDGARDPHAMSAVRALYVGGMHLKDAKKLVAHAVAGEHASAVFEPLRPSETIARELDACGFEGLFGVERRKATAHAAALGSACPCLLAD